MNPFWQIVGVIGLGLQAFVIYLMTKGPFRFYPWVFLYVLILFLTGVTDAAGIVGSASLIAFHERIYYINNTLRHVSGLLAVISLFFLATRGQPDRNRIRIRVLAILAILLALTLAWNFPGADRLQEDLPDYLGIVGRDMGFLTALMIMALWFALIRQRIRDRLLFLMSTGMGLNMTGEAIAVSLFLLAGNSIGPLVDIVSVGSHFLCLLIWIHALKLARKREQAAGTAASQ